MSNQVFETDYTEFAFTCGACGHSEAWTSEMAAKAASVWHVYHEHRDLWVQALGTADRLPVDKMPEDYGRKLEQRERQS